MPSPRRFPPSWSVEDYCGEIEKRRFVVGGGSGADGSADFAEADSEAAGAVVGF